MSDAPPKDAPVQDTPAELARAIAVHLEHRQQFHGQRYVSGTAIEDRAPSVEHAPASATPSAEDAPQGRAERSSPAATPGAPGRDPSAWTAVEKLQHLELRVIGDCRRCVLCETRRHIVFGEGDAQARVMVVGEAPGADEDRSGRPFVGRAGQRLDQWLGAVGLSRREVFIANVLKCRPPNNRDPFGPEVDACAKFLRAQIRAVQPALLVALGRFAASALLGRPVRMHEVRGRLHTFRDVRDSVDRPVCVLYHPAYVLRRERDARADASNVSENDAVLNDLRGALREVFRT